MGNFSYIQFLNDLKSIQEMRKSREIGQNSEDIRTEVENVVKSVSINSNSFLSINQVVRLPCFYRGESQKALLNINKFQAE